MTVWPSGLRRWLKAPFVRAWVRTPQLSIVAAGVARSAPCGVSMTQAGPRTGRQASQASNARGSWPAEAQRVRRSQDSRRVWARTLPRARVRRSRDSRQGLGSSPRRHCQNPSHKGADPNTTGVTIAHWASPHAGCDLGVGWRFVGSWPVGLMDKASASGAGDSRLESWAGHGRCCPRQAARCCPASRLSHPRCPPAVGRHDRGS